MMAHPCSPTVAGCTVGEPYNRMGDDEMPAKQETEQTSNPRQMVEIINREDGKKTFEWVVLADEKRQDPRDGQMYDVIKQRGNVTVGAACDRDLDKFDDEYPAPRVKVSKAVWDRIMACNPAVKVMLAEGRIDVVPA